MHGANLGTLLRTCDAVGACLAVPRIPWVADALARGNTLRRPACVHWTGRDVCDWLRLGARRRARSSSASSSPTRRSGSVTCPRHVSAPLPCSGTSGPASRRRRFDLLDVAVEIPMVGSGASLNVAVAGPLSCTGWPALNNERFPLPMPGGATAESLPSRSPGIRPSRPDRRWELAAPTRRVATMIREQHVTGGAAPPVLLTYVPCGAAGQGLAQPAATPIRNHSSRLGALG